jgi:EpsI family protein
MAATLAIVTAISARGVPAVIATNIERIPASIGEYSGTEDRFDQSVYDELDADRHIYRHYRSPGGNQVDFYMGYYGTAKGGRTPHNPYSCLPGSGWGIVKTGQVQMTPSYLGKPVKVNYILAQKGNVAESVIHWYQSAGTKVLSNGLEQNLHRFIGRAFFNRNDGAFIRISTTTSIENIDEADIRVLAFARQIIELLPQYWPEEK